MIDCFGQNVLTFSNKTVILLKENTEKDTDCMSDGTCQMILVHKYRKVKESRTGKETVPENPVRILLTGYRRDIDGKRWNVPHLLCIWCEIRQNDLLYGYTAYSTGFTGAFSKYS